MTPDQLREDAGYSRQLDAIIHNLRGMRAEISRIVGPGASNTSTERRSNAYKSLVIWLANFRDVPEFAAISAKIDAFLREKEAE